MTRTCRTTHSALFAALSVAIATCLATPARAQTTPGQRPRPAAPKPAPAPSTKKAVEIEVHGGFLGSSSATGGTGALPGAGTSFSAIGGSPTRSIPSWYFGDGNKLFNDFNKSAGLPSNVIASLDPALNTAATARQSGVSFGAGVSYPLTDRLAVEGNLDIANSHLSIDGSALNTIGGSVATFKSRFTTGLTGAANLSVTSASTIVDSQGGQMTVTGGLRINLLTRGRITPFVTVGGGVVHATGTDTVKLVGNYTFVNPLACATCVINETDTVNITYASGGSKPALEFGGGLKGNTSGRLGWRMDIRVYMSKNANTTTFSASPTVATPAAASQSALAFVATPTIQFSNIPGIKSSLSGAAITDFASFTGTGMRVQAAFTGGITFRF